MEEESPYDHPMLVGHYVSAPGESAVKIIKIDSANDWAEIEDHNARRSIAFSALRPLPITKKTVALCGLIRDLTYSSETHAIKVQGDSIRWTENVGLDVTDEHDFTVPISGIDNIHELQDFISALQGI